MAVAFVWGKCFCWKVVWGREAMGSEMEICVALERGVNIGVRGRRVFMLLGAIQSAREMECVLVA